MAATPCRTTSVVGTPYLARLDTSWPLCVVKAELSVSGVGVVERAVGERVGSTEEAVERLREALRGVGVVLPSLRVDPVTGASREPFPLVDLGRCNLLVAARLAAVLREAAGDDGCR
jgi:hypothetical protein